MLSASSEEDNASVTSVVASVDKCDNFTSTVSTINVFLPLVRKSRIKKITVILRGKDGFEFVIKAKILFTMAYGALKAALNIIVLKYSIKLKSEGIILLALSPWVINTREE